MENSSNNSSKLKISASIAWSSVMAAPLVIFRVPKSILWEITSLIIDLRDNGGGIVNEATDIANYILDKDSEIIITVDKNGKEEITKSKDNPIINIPIVILVNENTASASEILTGALQDNEKAIVIGNNTYGKGVIQELYSLKDGSGLKVTTSEYYTPNRNKINKIGITPDYEIDLIKENDTDEQLQKAIEILNERWYMTRNSNSMDNFNCSLRICSTFHRRGALKRLILNFTCF